MELSALDWGVILLYGLVTVAVGLAVAKRAGSGTGEFFLSGRSLPWWALGVSLVATTFSTDTPNLVTDMVRTGGVSQNWSWWAFLITGMCTVFLYARLWRRSEAMTDIGFYELRYSGRPAAFLRGFRALYLGVFFNVMIMASVNLAAMKISGVLLGFDREATLLVCAAVTVLYAASSGLRSAARAMIAGSSSLVAAQGCGCAVGVAAHQPCPDVAGSVREKPIERRGLRAARRP